MRVFWFCLGCLVTSLIWGLWVAIQRHIRILKLKGEWDWDEEKKGEW